jgi:hypothetical protein
MLLAMQQAQERIERLEQAIRVAVPDWSLAEVVTALMALRGSRRSQASSPPSSGRSIARSPIAARRPGKRTSEEEAARSQIYQGAALCAFVHARSPGYPRQGFRSAIGILGLVKRYGPERVDAACAPAQRSLNQVRRRQRPLNHIPP